MIECECSTLEIDGPEGFAVRLEAPAHVGGDEVTAGVPTPSGRVRLSHFDPSVVVDTDHFETRLWANPVSFQAASELVEELVGALSH